MKKKWKNKWSFLGKGFLGRKSMFEIFSIFGSSILAAIMIAACLSFVGPLMVARGNGTHVLAVGQGASLGVMTGILILGTDHEAPLTGALIPWISGLGFALLTFYGLEVFGKGRKANFVFHLSAFSLLSAMGGIMKGIFPRIESHVTNLFLGDVVTIPHQAALGYSLFGFILLAILFLKARSLLDRSFEIEILKSKSPIFTDAFLGITLLLVTLSVLNFGLLFTLSCLFIPTAILSGIYNRGAFFHLSISSGIGALGAGTGFLVSLSWDTLGTSSAIVISTLFLAGITLFFLGFLRGKN